MRCPQCNEEIADGMKFCTNCGAKMPEMRICPKCGQPVEDGLKFCTNCGTKLEEAQIPEQVPVMPTVEQPQMQVPVMPTAEQPQPQMQMPVQPTVQPQAQTPVMPQVHTNYTQPQVQTQPHRSSNSGNVLQQMSSSANQGIAPEKPKKKFPVVPVIIIAILVIAIAVLVVVMVNMNKKNKNADKSTANQTGIENNYTNPEDDPHYVDLGTPTQTDPTPTTEKKKTTVMMYIIGSNLESRSGCVTSDLKEMMAADLENTNVIIQTGGCTKWQNNIVKGNTVQRFSLENKALVELADMGRISMVEQQTLTDFIRFAAENYPAEKYVLMLWDHGGGVPIGFGVDELFDGILYDYEIGQALGAAGVHFESVLFDACDMCTLEVALALKPHADYLLAAESLVDGVGMSYTNWLNVIDDDPVTSIKYGETIIKDYMESLKVAQSPGSMSMIILERVDAIYAEYEKYMGDVYRKLKNGDYAEYYKARNSCGMYESSDSVDMITLATMYQTDHSDTLRRAVQNSVAYTESDYKFGYGLAVYSPFNDIWDYDDGRVSMVELGYSQNILDCYDSFVSLYYAYQGNSYVNDYAGDWYDSEVVEEYVPEGTEAGDYYLETTMVNGQEVISMSDDFWNIVTDVTVTMVLMNDDNHGLLLGEDYYYRTDNYGNILIAPPESWEYINGVPCAYYCQDEYTDPETGEWSQEGCTLAYVNGRSSLVLIYFDEDYPQGTLVGYVPFDFNTMQRLTDENYISFEYGDTIDLAFGEMDINTTEVKYYSYGSPVAYEDTVLTYDYINGEECHLLTYYTIHDVYGNTYETDMFELGK